MKDIIIIGGGPAGLTAALYASRAGADVTIIESGAPGGKLNLTAHIENYPGIKEMMGPQLAYDMYEQALNFGAQLKMTEVKSIVDEGDYKKVITSKEELEARVVIIATGTKERKMGLHLEDEMTGKGISYCAVCDGPLYKNKDVAVLGGGNSALEEALYLTNVTSKVYLIHRRNEFRGDKKVIEQIENNPKIILKLSLTIEELIGDKSLEQIKLNNGEVINVSALFPYIGQIPNTQFLSFTNLCNENGYIIVNNNMDTNVPGLFAAGDVTNQKLKQVVTATSDGAIAATSVIEYLRG